MPASASPSSSTAHTARPWSCFNGFYIGRHSGGYDPFSFDVTDFAYPGQRNVLLVRVDATESDGWFYEGAGIYRHVWLVKTNPVHVKKWGTLVTSQIRPGEATLSILTEVSNRRKAAREARVVSTILDPSGKVVGKNAADVASDCCRAPSMSYRTGDRGAASRACGRWKSETFTSWSPRFNPAGKSWIAMRRPSEFAP